MKFLFDQNLSPRLQRSLSVHFPSSAHVSQIELDRAPDRIVWDYALENGFTIVTKDADFSELSVLFGFPPKVIWIRRGNCSTDDIAALLEENLTASENLASDSASGILVLL